MITFDSGNIFYSDCEALVNPVNCVGVSGKGLALAFKKKYPAMFETYRQACLDKQLKIGCLHVWYGEKIIINFPTKIHWRDPSKLEWIEIGLKELANGIIESNIKSIALPALGTGCGGLSFDLVKPLIEKIHNQYLENIKVEVYLPIP